jgi:hypothetical protein
MGHKQLRPDSAKSRHSVAQEKHSFRDITIFDLYPPTMKDNAWEPMTRPK